MLRDERAKRRGGQLQRWVGQRLGLYSVLLQEIPQIFDSHRLADYKLHLTPKMLHYLGDYSSLRHLLGSSVRLGDSEHHSEFQVVKRFDSLLYEFGHRCKLTGHHTDHTASLNVD